MKRGIKQSNHPYNSIKELSFSALGKDFRLILHPSKGILHHNFQSYSVDGDGVEKPILGGLHTCQFIQYFIMYFFLTEKHYISRGDWILPRSGIR